MQTGPTSTERRPRRWRGKLCFTLSLIVIAGALMFWLRPNPAPAVVLLSAWPSNGEEFVTFQVQPLDAEVHFADIVSFSEDNSQPPILNFSSNASQFVRDVAIPVAQGLSVRYVALPFEWVDRSGSNQPGTPGSYTIAYTPTSTVNQLRVGVAKRESPFAASGWAKRIRKAEESKNFRYLVMPTHVRPVYVKSAPITNSAVIAN